MSDRELRAAPKKEKRIFVDLQVHLHPLVTVKKKNIKVTTVLAQAILALVKCVILGPALEVNIPQVYILTGPSTPSPVCAGDVSIK